MARAASTEGKSKSDIVRDYLKIHSSANVAQIVSDLKPYGISRALAQKIKYDKGRDSGARASGARGSGARGSGARGGGARKARPQSAARSSGAADNGRGAKAQAIRDIAEILEKPIRPRDVISALADRGVKVSYAQVGQVLKGMGMRRRRRRKGGRRAAAAHLAAAPASTGLSIEALIAAKKLADQLGSVQAAKQAMDAIARLS